MAKYSVGNQTQHSLYGFSGKGPLVKRAREARLGEMPMLFDTEQEAEAVATMTNEHFSKTQSLQCSPYSVQEVISATFKVERHWSK